MGQNTGVNRQPSISKVQAAPALRFRLFPTVIYILYVQKCHNYI